MTVVKLASEAVLEVLTENVLAMRKAYAESHRMALIAHGTTNPANIDHWNRVSRKFHEKGDLLNRMGRELAHTYGIDYVRFRDGVK